MKVSVDSSRCEGHGQCEIVAPDIFTLDDDGYSNIGEGKSVPPGREGDVELGLAACPVQALRAE